MVTGSLALTGPASSIRAARLQGSPLARLGGQLPDYVDDGAAARTESRWWRRLGSSFVSADSYGLVLLLVVATYAISVSMTEARAASIVLTVQLATVWLTLRTSQARRLVRLVADGVLFQPRPSRSATEATDVNGAGSA